MIYNLIYVKFIKRNHSVSTVTDDAQKLAWKTLFRKHDCFPAYHCLDVANQRSLEILALVVQKRVSVYIEQVRAQSGVCLRF